jgi:membrane-associated phospholipid phosphatase
MTFKQWYLFLLIISIAEFSTSPPAIGQTIGTIIVQDTKIIVNDAGKIFNAPTHFGKSQWLETGATVMGTILLFKVDKPVRTLAQHNHTNFNDRVFEVGWQYGNVFNWLLLTGGLYSGGLIFRMDDAHHTGRMLMESIAFAGLITSTLKSLTGRSRPYLDEGPFKYRGFQFKTGTTSLPSGHTTVAFAVSSILANRIKNNFAAVGLYSLASLTGISRVYHDAHWISDNFLGAVIGTCIGLTVIHLNEKDENHTRIFVRPSSHELGLEFFF